MDRPAKWFDEAVRSDAAGDAGLAFSQYLRAAEAGMPSAEFNVAVMLDSGRGVRADLAEAATWYARAGAHGSARAAFNLGQLYEAGEGVPKNIDLARSWFAASGLPAARERVAASRANPATTTTASWAAPHPVAPAAGAHSNNLAGGVELVWTALPQPEAVQFYVELRALDADGSLEVFSSFVDKSSIFAEAPMTAGAYAWRVICIAKKAGKYVASDWVTFEVEPRQQLGRLDHFQQKSEINHQN